MSEFFEFLRKATALALAVAVIIGTAISKVVSSVVAAVLMPIMSLFVGGGEWRALQIPREKSAPPGPLMQTYPACAESALTKATASNNPEILPHARRKMMPFRLG
jgi:large conductance mechanosensitive channel